VHLPNLAAAIACLTTRSLGAVALDVAHLAAAIARTISTSTADAIVGAGLKERGVTVAPAVVVGRGCVIAIRREATNVEIVRGLLLFSFEGGLLLAVLLRILVRGPVAGKQRLLTDLALRVHGYSLANWRIGVGRHAQRHGENCSTAHVQVVVLQICQSAVIAVFVKLERKSDSLAKLELAFQQCGACKENNE
jgi:hypothetical protein